MTLERLLRAYPEPDDARAALFQASVLLVFLLVCCWLLLVCF